MKQLLSISLLILAGCTGIVPVKTTESQAVKTTEAIAARNDMTVKKAVEGQRATVVTSPPITVSGKDNTVVLKSGANTDAVARPYVVTNAAGAQEVHFQYDLPSLPQPAPTYRETTSVTTSGNQNAGDSTKTLSSFAQSIPWGVTLILAAIGIGLLYYVVRMVINSSASAKAAFAAGDTLLKNRIDALRNNAMKATDPAVVAAHVTDIASLEADRGKLAAVKP